MPRTASTTKIILSALILLCALGCAQPKSESVMPHKTETCNGTAIKNQFIVHYKNGRWDFQKATSREEFKSKYVEPNFYEIDFIEYDQKIQTHEEVPLQVSASMGINNWAIPVISVESAWQNGHRGHGVIVAIIDTGVDINHPQLSSRIFKNSGETPNNGIDDDQNGFIDDYTGYSFYDDTSNVVDNSGHGTHVAGIVAAYHNDNQHREGYTQGVAPEAKILPVKFLDSSGGTLSSALKGIDYAVAQGAKVINASWGGNGCSQSLRQKLTEVSEKNVLFVTASGNSGLNLEKYPEYPAAYNLPYQLTIGSIGETLLMSSFTNYSRKLVHLFAPGSMIVSTVPGGAYAGFSGTSMATPFVSGAAAILLSASTSSTIADVQSAILQSVHKNDLYQNQTRGRLNVSKALDLLLNP